MAELMAKEAYRNRINDIIKMKNENKDDFNLLKQRLKEKGTEYTIIVPLFEVILEYDPLYNLSFEYSSDDYNNQRFDISIRSKEDRYMLIEAKALGKDIAKSEREQMINYLEYNEKCPWGILTNGIEWLFFICRDYIETFINKGRSLTQKKEKVFLCMNLNINEKHFIDFMLNFKHEKIDNSWERIGNFCLKIIEGGGGAHPKIHDGEKEVDEYIKEKIKEELIFNKGAYFDLIQSGKLNQNQQVICENDFLKVEFILDKIGKLVIQNVIINDYKKFSEHCNTENISKWINENFAFNSARDFRIQLDQDFTKKQTQTLKDRYPFDIDSEDFS